MLVFHGTTKENAESILRTGFNKESWFAFHLEDALAYGGEYVFTVKLDAEKLNNEPDWQFFTNEHIPKEKIQRLERYDKTVIYEVE